ncbi:Copper transport protein ctr4 [Tolypocladium paradoxum]|uniref:Copper transport protein n=1 Tax=Tolypocladium paradoxum TaxID=94208 RepID=A0A2S4KNA1_9HYPO|nr:Copper transport protein ctr4 [Tolypocladium paradoxum]
MDMTTTAMSGMDHSHHTMSMDMPAQTSAAMDHGAMDHGAMNHSAMDHDMGGMGMGGGCKISMLFNLNTIDACFLTEQWHITSSGMFAGSCIGVFLLGMALEFLRRSVKEFDRYLIKQHVAKYQTAPGAPVGAEGDSVSSKEATPPAACAVIPPFRPSVLQQAIRAGLHCLTFSVGYVLMLLAMYFNVYIIISIFLGAFCGAFIFQWETLPTIRQQTSAAQDATVCCG